MLWVKKMLWLVLVLNSLYPVSIFDRINTIEWME